jgi:hypothetical protein
MVAAEHERKFACLHDLFNVLRELLARTTDLLYIFKSVVRFRNYVRSIETEIAKITNTVTETTDSLIQTSNAQCGGTHINAGHARAITQRYAEYAYCLA